MAATVSSTSPGLKGVDEWGVCGIREGDVKREDAPTPSIGAGRLLKSSGGGVGPVVATCVGPPGETYLPVDRPVDLCDGGRKRDDLCDAGGRRAD